MKLLFCSLFLSAWIVGFAQEQPEEDKWKRNNLNLRIGPELAFPLGDLGNTQNLGLGFSALLDLPLMPRLSLVVYAGALTLGGKDSENTAVKYQRANIFPARAGINYKLSPNFYAGAQLGRSTLNYLGVTQGAISQSLGIGYFNGKLDAGVRWDQNYRHNGISSINIKIAYVIQFRLKS